METELLYEEPKLEVLQVHKKEEVITTSPGDDEDEWTGFY